MVQKNIVKYYNKIICQEIKTKLNTFGNWPYTTYTFSDSRHNSDK